MLSGKNTESVPVNKSWTRCFQVSLSVWTMLISGGQATDNYLATYVVIHVRRAKKVDGVAVRELGLVYIGAVRFDMGAVVDIIVCVHEADPCDPVPCLFGPVGISCVACVAC